MRRIAPRASRIVVPLVTSSPVYDQRLLGAGHLDWIGPADFLAARTAAHHHHEVTDLTSQAAGWKNSAGQGRGHGKVVWSSRK
jgi:hypothetical protein